MSKQLVKRAIDFLDRGEEQVDAKSFIEEPVSLETFVGDKGYLNLPPLSDIQFSAIEVAQTIFFRETYDLLKWTVPEVIIDELVLEWGKGSGKDYVSRIMLSRIAYLLLCLNNPQGYYGISQESQISMLNVAYNAPQANNIFFEPFRRMIHNSRWFRDRYEDKIGHIKFEKNILAYSGHSDQEGLEGENLIAAVMDEVAAFKTKAELGLTKSPRAGQHSADALYDSLRSSIQSRFPGIGKIILISYPRYKDDFIQTKYEEGKSLPNVYVSFGSTWEVNPLRRKIDFKREYDRNPEGSEARYECNPQRSGEDYFKMKDKIKVSFHDDTKDLSKDPVDGEGYAPWFTPKAGGGKPRGVHVDLSIRNDRAGMAMAYVDGWIRKQYNKVFIRVPVVVIELMRSWQAEESKEIDISEVRQHIFMLKDMGFNIQLVTYDGFQSAESIQTLLKRGIEADLLSVDRNTGAYDTLKELIYDDRLKAYYNPLVIKELDGLVRISGNKVDHKAGGSKDLSDACAGAVWNAIDLVSEDREVEFYSRSMPLAISTEVAV